MQDEIKALKQGIKTSDQQGNDGQKESKVDVVCSNLMLAFICKKKDQDTTLISFASVLKLPPYDRSKQMMRNHAFNHK